MSDGPIFVTGASGYLGHEVVAEFERRGIDFQRIGRDEGFDLADPFALAVSFEELLVRAERAPVLLHMGAMSKWGACEDQPEVAWRVNMEATGALVSVLRRRSSGRVIYTSTDLVFDGERAPYDEDDEPRPGSTYGKSKAGGERMVLGAERGLVVRVPLLYGPSFDGARGASDGLLRRLETGGAFRLFTDEWRTPLDVRDAARGIVDLVADDDATGIRHLPGPERLSRYELGERVIREAGVTATLQAGSRLEGSGPPRPRDCSLASNAGS